MNPNLSLEKFPSQSSGGFAPDCPSEHGRSTCKTPESASTHSRAATFRALRGIFRLNFFVPMLSDNNNLSNEKFGMNKFLILIFFLPVCAWAENIELSLDEAVQRALKVNEQVLVQKETYLRTHRTYKKVRASALPSVTAEWAWDRYIETPVISVDMGNGVQNMPVKQDWEMNTSVTLTQVLWAFGKVSTAIQIAHEGMGMYLSRLNASENDAALAVKKAYYTLLLSQNTVRISQESRQNALANQRAMERRFRGGRVSRVENIKMAADAENRVPIQLEAENNLSALTISFKRMVGLAPQDHVVLKDGYRERFPAYSFYQLKSRMEKNEPGLQALRANVQVNERIIKLRQADRCPVLSLYSNYQYGGTGMASMPEEMNPAFVSGLRLSWPVWDSGARRNASYEAVHDMRVARLEYEKAWKDALADLETLLTEYAAVHQILKAHQKAQGLAKDAYQITLSSYESGSASQSQLNDAELQWTQSRLNVEQSLYRLHIIMAEIQKWTGGDSL